MSLRSVCFSFLLALLATPLLAQDPPPPPPAASPTPAPVPKLAEQLSRTLASVAERGSAPREIREQAYAKLLEGQRYLWRTDRIRSRAGREDNSRLAREAFVKAVELDPTLAEGYNALAEMAISGQTQDINEAIALATLATKVNPNSFGGRRILARLYSFQSRLAIGTFNREAAEKAIPEWRHVARLDPRNAEAWAFLSELYDRTGRTEEGVEALRKWLASAAPVDGRFYQMVMGGQNLAPENAAIKLGTMLLKAGRTREAIETLSLLIAEDSDNFAAVDLLRDAIENADASSAAVAIESLTSAVRANPSNVSLLNLLAQVQIRAGRIDDATSLLKTASTRLEPTDRSAAAALYVGLGDLLRKADRPDRAVAAYEAALSARGLDNSLSLAPDESEFTQMLFEKIIQTHKGAGKTDEARAAIERARKMLGSEDLFADRHLISLLRESGNRPEALAAVRAARKRAPSDQGLLRQEATLLTETGKVDEGVALIKQLMDTTRLPPPTPITSGNSETITIPVPPTDAFSNYLFISNLYTQANRGKEAIEAANQAFGVARGAERKQIARLTLATAQQMSGDIKGAEATLRDLLKETPGNPIAMNNLGYFLLERNERIEEAFDLIQRAVKIDPTNPSYLDSLGWAYFKLGKLPEAEKYLKEALRHDSSSGTINEHLGDVYQKQGKTDLAKAAWARAVTLFSDAADVERVKKKLGQGR